MFDGVRAPRYADPMPRRPTTSTSNFGVGRREGHDATGFYERFRSPELTIEDTVLPPEPVAEPFVCGDARNMDTIADGSVALVVTSPPYFAGKQYEEELERDGIPSRYRTVSLLHVTAAEPLDTTAAA
jgi:site-specific DNA-methyltransferase (adenine-specific)